LTTLLKYIRFLSLDVTLGAALLTTAISDFIGVELPLSVPVCLAISIWLIYTLDHLLDASRSTEITIERHLFHRRNFKTLVINLILIALAGFYVAWSLPTITFIYGLGLILLVLVYFTLIYFFKNFHFKEALVAIVYASGVFLGPVSLIENGVSLQIISLFTQLLFLALINLILFSYNDLEKDQADGNPSIVIKLGREMTQQVLMLFFILLIVVQLGSLLFFLNNPEFLLFQILFIMMTAVLLSLKKWNVFFALNSRYQLIGDSIFFLPAVWLLL
jgi:4-hydroxybenzoate polyprenyltransferase